MLFGWYESAGTISGAVSLTPPFDLLLAEVPLDAVDDLATTLISNGVDLPGAGGEVSTADAFATAWTARVPVSTEVTMRMRLYRLERLRMPPLPPGQPRRA